MAVSPPLRSSGTPARNNAPFWILAGVGGVLALCATAALGLWLLATYTTYKIREARSGHHGVLPKSSERLTPFGRAKLPAWVPDYPGSSKLAILSTTGRKDEDGIFTFHTDDSPDNVYQYYRNQLRSSGMKVNASARTRILVAQDGSRKHKITVMIGTQANQTSVTVNYATNK